MRSRTTPLILTAILCCIPATATAETGRQLELEVGVGAVDEDWLLTTRLGFFWFTQTTSPGCVEGDCTAPVKAALGAPIRWQLTDDDPKDGGAIRQTDWDDPGDFFRIARFLQFGESHQTLYARFGELGAVDLGHGTIAGGYLNTLTIGDFNPGFEAAANTRYGGLQVFLDDVTRPRVFGLRGHVRPWGFGESRFLGRLSFGLSAVSDFAAPLTVATGDPVRGAPVVEEAESVTIVGLDIDLTTVETDTSEWWFYADGNAGVGLGAHLGTVLRLGFGEWWISVRAEGRAVGENYLPNYFGPFYRVQRYQMVGWGRQRPQPKRVLAELDRRQALLGAMGQLSVSWRELVTLDVSAAEHGGPADTSAWIRLSFAPPGPFSAGVYWAQPAADADALLDWESSLLAAEARVAVFGPLYVHGRVDHLFRLEADGTYVPALDWSAGAGASLSF